MGVEKDTSQSEKEKKKKALKNPKQTNKQKKPNILRKKKNHTLAQNEREKTERNKA